MFIISVALIVCVIIAAYYSEEIKPFVFSSIISFILGVLFYLATRKQRENVSIGLKEAYLTVTLSWLIISLLGCLPYLLSGSIPYFVNAFFESVSGFTTTGSSILINIESLPKSILFWRSLTHWIGGIGIIVLVIVVMPTLHIGGYHLFTMESSLQEKIQPKIKAVGNRLLLIYLFLTVSEIIFLLAGKMNLFESVCHSFGTVATGGFSPRNASISEYSPYIQYVIMVFMLLAGTNFVVHYYFLKRNFRKVRNNDELKLYLSVVLIIGLITTASLFLKTHKSIEESFREAFFQVISIISCTGFATADYLQWPGFGWILIFICMFLGGSTGSTAGGIKMVRHLILLKNIKRMFRNLLHPDAVMPIKLNNNPVEENINVSVISFIMIYILIFISGSFLMIIIGTDPKTAGGAVATCMAGIGPGIGTVGPAGNFAHLPDAGKLILSFLMLLGRLEIYTIMVLFTRNFWRA